MTEPKEDFATTIKHNAKSIGDLSMQFNPRVRCVLESVALDAYAQSMRDRNQQLQQLLKEFPDWDKHIQQKPHENYTMALTTFSTDCLNWKAKLEAFLKATTTEETIK